MKTCIIDQLQAKPKSDRKWLWRSFAFGAGITFAVFVIQFERGRQDEYATMKARDAASTKRAESAEAQLALTMKHGDCGTLLFNIDPDLGPSQLRLLQVTPRRK